MGKPTKRTTKTGGREAIEGVIPGRYSLSVGNPGTPTPDGWKWTLLQDVARLESGHTPSRRKPEYWAGDIPWIGIRDATGNHGRTLLDTQQHTNELGVQNSSTRVLPANTVCLSRTASVGYVVVMGVPMCTSQDFVNWVCSPRDLDYRFLKYVLLAEHETYLSFASGTTHQTIYYPEVKAFHVCLPPISAQSRIADTLQALDDLIENNRRRVEVLEEMARAIYREWFVHFRFPGHADTTFVDSDLGPIPEGWRVASLGDVITFNYGKSLKKDTRRGGEVAVLGSSGLIGWHDEELVQGPAIVVGRKGNVGSVTWVDGPAWPIDTTYYVATDLPLRYVCEHVRGIEFLNTHAAVPGLSRDQAYSKRFLVPNGLTLEGFEEASNILYGQASLLASQVDQLGKIRDMLLPKLVTGQIDVSQLDLDAVVERAGV